MRVPDRDFVCLSLARDGRLAEPEALDHLASRVPAATDCERVTLLRVAVHWASTPFADDGQGGTPDLVLGLGDLARSEPGRLEQVLRAMAEVEVPQGPEEELELEAVALSCTVDPTGTEVTPAEWLLPL